MNKLVATTLLIFCFMASTAQDTLPDFSATNPGNNRIIIGWTNTFETIKQISIQRSLDSLKNFKTILTVADPTAPQNGFADTKAPNDQVYYRLYILLDKGVYLFSPSKKAVYDTVRKYEAREPVEAKAPVIIGESETMSPVINNKPKTEIFVPSKRVYTLSDGYVRIDLPEDEGNKYSIRFYTIEDEFLFELKDVKERSFRIDKANFYHAGWFKFELFENEELLEKHRFYLPKEF